jgi:hypothetical protein
MRYLVVVAVIVVAANVVFTGIVIGSRRDPPLEDSCIVVGIIPILSVGTGDGRK